MGIPEAEKRKQELHEEGVKPPKRMKRSDIRYFMQAEPECSAEAKIDSTSRNIQAEQVLGHPSPTQATWGTGLSIS